MDAPTPESAPEAELLLVLDRERQAIVRAALDSIRHSRTHYGATEVEKTRRRLEVAYGEMCAAVACRDLGPVVRFARQLAAERFQSGYDLSEVQSAFNALEEATWSVLCAQLPPDAHALALGLVSTVLGAAKEALAREYVSLASQARAPSLDLRALFSGAGT